MRLYYDERITYDLKKNCIVLYTHNCKRSSFFPSVRTAAIIYKRTRQTSAAAVIQQKKTPRTIFHKRKITLLLRRPFFNSVGLYTNILRIPSYVGKGI